MYVTYRRVVDRAWLTHRAEDVADADTVRSWTQRHYPRAERIIMAGGAAVAYHHGEPTVIVTGGLATRTDRDRILAQARRLDAAMTRPAPAQASAVDRPRRLPAPSRDHVLVEAEIHAAQAGFHGARLEEGVARQLGITPGAYAIYQTVAAAIDRYAARLDPDRTLLRTPTPTVDLDVDRDTPGQADLEL